MKRAVIYARFSSDMQREESIEAQIRAGKALCQRKGYELIGVYIDEAKSGTSITGRDNYNRMMADAMEHKFDVAVFHKVDRNARNEFDYYTFKRSFEMLGIDYEYSGQSVDDTPEGQMMESLLVGMAAYYSRNLAKETKKGLNENAYKAMFNGGVPPLGYKIVDGKYVIDESEAKAVRMIFDMYVSGRSYVQITRALAANGFRTRKGNHFAKNSLYDILDNERYIGVYTFNKIIKDKNGKRNTHGKPSAEFLRIENALPAIVSKETFDNARRIKESRRHKGGQFNAKVQYILSGKIYCGICGGSYCGTHTRVREKDYYYYSCTKKERVPAFHCSNKAVRKSDIEYWVLESLLKKILTPKGVKIISAEMEKAYAEMVAESDTKLKDLDKKIKAAKTKLDNLYKLVECGEIDVYDRERIRNIKEELAELNKTKNDLSVLESRPVCSKVEIANTINALRTAVKSNDYEAQKTLVNLFVERITIDVDTITLVVADEMFWNLMVPRTRIIQRPKFMVKIQRIGITSKDCITKSKVEVV